MLGQVRAAELIFRARVRPVEFVLGARIRGAQLIFRAAIWPVEFVLGPRRVWPAEQVSVTSHFSP